MGIRGHYVKARELTRGMHISLYPPREGGYEISYVDHGANILVTLMDGQQVPYEYDSRVLIWERTKD